MRYFTLARLLMIALTPITAYSQTAPELPRMVSPTMDAKGQPFSYVSQSTDQISVMHATAGTEITPQGSLYTGYGELMFFTGIERKSFDVHVRTLEDGYLPIVHYSIERDGIQYRFTMFAASLGTQQDGKRVVNMVRVTMFNPNDNVRHGYLTTAWRYQSEQQTSYATGDNRFERPVKAKRLGDYEQPGQVFDANWVYTATEDTYLQNGRAIYFFPAHGSLSPTMQEYYNFRLLAPVKLHGSITPQTPVASAEYAVELRPHAEKSLDFKMPLAPIMDAQEMQAVRAASFDERKEQVEAFWRHQLDNGIEIETSEAKVNDTYKTSLVNTLMSLNKVGDDYVQAINQLHYHGFYLRDSADFVRMYDTSNYPEIGRQVVDFFATRQDADGNFFSQPGQFDGWGEALWTYGEHYRMTHDRKFAESIYPRVLRSMDWLTQALAKDPLHIMPYTDVRDNEFVPGHLTGYNFLALDGLQAAQLLAHDLGHPEDEERFRKIETDLRSAFMSQLNKVSSKLGNYIPPCIDEGCGGTDWGNLLSIVPEQQLDPMDPHVTATLQHTQSLYQEGLMTYRQEGQGTYLHHYLTMKNTQTELIRGEQEQAIREFYAVLMHTSSTNAGWEYSIRPWGNRDFSGNLAPHGWFATEYRNLLRTMIVREEGSRLHLFSALSPEWIGAGKTITVRRAATYFGIVQITLKMASDTEAVLDYSLEGETSWGPKEVTVHLPWFVHASSATQDGKALPINGTTLMIPTRHAHVTLHWNRVALPQNFPASYEKTVNLYKTEYRDRYERLTGVRETR